MPQLTFPVTRDGLSVPVWLGLAGKTIAALHSVNLPIPPPVQVRGLLDTGSNVTAVASWVLRQLAVPMAATASSQTAAGQVAVKLYEVSLSITDPNQPGTPMLTYPDLLVSELVTVLADTDVLIGLDVLLECRLQLDGPARQFRLDF